ncbi:MAG: sterol desaturase family protein [bacterium]
MAKSYVSNKDESIPLFKNKWLDKFTYVHPTVPVILYLPVIAFFMRRGLVANDFTVAAIVGLFAGGFLLWTLTEYLMHRFVFHFEPKSHWGQYLHHLMHGVHHDYPNDSRRLVMPPVVSIPLAFFFYGLFTVLIPAVYLPVLFSGFVFGYVCYDVIHYATHHFPMKGRIGLWLKHHHIRHHYQNPELGYGVSSPLWDVVFGTTFPEKAQEKSAG